MKTLNWVKILFIALSLVLAFSLVACVSETPVESDSETEESIDEGNGSVADTDKAPAESGSESTPDEETSSETEPAPACAHTECTETAAKAATCTEAGNDAYKICNACEAIIDANGNVISAIPTIAALGHTEVVDAGTPADCENAGLTEGKHCSVCNEVLVAQTPIDALGHNIVDKAWTAPTTAEEGWEAHKACDRCGKAWTTEDEALEAAPSIDKIVPTTNKYFGFEELKNKTIGGVAGSLFATTPAGDRSYVRFERTGNSDDGNIYLLEGNTDATGKFFVIKYRTDHMNRVQLWANTLDNGHDGGKSNAYHPVVADGEWRILIVDLSSLISKYVKADENGDYTIQWARIDMLDGNGESGYFDIAFIAYCDDIAEVASVFQNGDADLCPHIVGENPVFINLGEKHSTTCALCGDTITLSHSVSGKPEWNTELKSYAIKCACGADVEKSMLYVTESSTEPGQCNLFTVEEKDGYVRYTKSGTGDSFVHFYIKGTVVTGSFAVIKYRVSKEGLSYNNSFVGSVMGTHNTNASAGCDSNTSSTRSGNFAYNGDEWQYLVIEAKSTCFVANEDGTYSFGFLRLGFSAFAVDDYIEVDEIAFADNKYAADLYAFGDSAVCGHETITEAWDNEAQVIKSTCVGCGLVTERVCDHAKANKVWNAETELYDVVCPDCGSNSPIDMIFKTEGVIGNSNVGSQSDYISATEQEGGIIRYTANKNSANADPTDPYFYPIRYNSNVTGQYLVIKYRLSNNGTNITTEHYFASSAASGQTGAAGKNGDNGVNAVGDKVLYADGEWHYIVFTPNLESNKTFTANADGTYSWAYIRMRLAGWTAYDGSCYLEIDEIAFADNMTAVNNYIGVTEAE
ncbi:MAG: hypothetical protein J6S10_03175 [Clostridia bacterium]|nr:hypothetical protein [Clostridia bacterium]